MNLIKIVQLTLITVFGLTLMPDSDLFARQAAANAEIHLFARYVDGKGVELRWFSDDNEVMKNGTQNGFVVERRIAGTGIYQDIQTVMPLSETEAEQLLQSTGDVQRAERLSVVTELKDAQTGPVPGTINFDNALEDLLKRKSAEDFRTMVFLLSSFEDSLAAKILGFSHTDAGVVAGQTYEYRARLVSPDGLSVTSPATTVTATETAEEYEIPIFVNEGDSELSFIWEQPGNVVGMYVERSMSENGTYESLNDVMILNMTGHQYDGPQRGTFADENLNNYRSYYYRFYGQNAFGERVLFGTATGTPRDLTPPSEPLMLQPKHASEDTVLVRWEMHGDMDDDLAGFVILRGEGTDELFDRINPSLIDQNVREFVDLDFNRDNKTFYAVQAVDTAGNVSSSYPLPVSYIRFNPPARPEIGQATIGEDGAVEIIIQPDPEGAVDGYKVFMGNDREHEFSPVIEFFGDGLVTPGEDVVIRDTVEVNTLTRNVFYQVRAYDVHFNESEASEVIVLERPDIVPPPRPVFKSVKASAVEIELEVALPTIVDFRSAVLYRRTDGTDWQQVHLFRGRETLVQFIDRRLEPGMVYYYRLQAEDQSGLLSDYSNPVRIQTVNRRLVQSVENLSVRSGSREANLRWSYPVKNGEYFFVIYRSAGEGSFRQVGRTEETQFTDRRIRPGSYEYQVRTYRKDGNQSDFSETVAVRVN